MDTWHYLRGLSEAFSPRNLEKISFHTSSNNFTRLCEVENSSTPFLPSWSILHGHAKISFRFSPLSCSQNPFCSISHDCANFLHVHVRWKNIVFNSFLSFLPFLSFDSTSSASKSQSKPIALLLSLCVWILINFICFLQLDSSLLSPIYQNHTLK